MLPSWDVTLVSIKQYIQPIRQFRLSVWCHFIDGQSNLPLWEVKRFVQVTYQVTQLLSLISLCEMTL